MEINAAEFKAKCLKLLDEVAATHEPLVITKRGKPVAKLVPIGEVSPAVLKRRARASRALQAIGRDMESRGGPITREEILEWVHEGRR